MLDSHVTKIIPMGVTFNCDYYIFYKILYELYTKYIIINNEIDKTFIQYIFNSVGVGSKGNHN